MNLQPRLQHDIFVFGSKIFIKEPKRDAITTLPLELSWRIFSYLDDESLRVAHNMHGTWARIISANLKLRRRLSRFALALKLGPKLAKFHRRNKRIMKETGRNYLRTSQTIYSMKKTVMRSKRSGDDITVHTKRYKLF